MEFNVSIKLNIKKIHFAGSVIYKWMVRMLLLFIDNRNIDQFAVGYFDFFS
jgi:hypothetical protein